MTFGFSPSFASRAVSGLLLAACAAALGGCAMGKDPRDPLENFNRAMFTVNDKLDQYALKPTAEVYHDKVPSFVQTGVYNFFGNLGDIWTAVNELLQAKFADGVSDVMRVAINTGFGFGGVLDIASEAGLSKHKQDLGLTLGTWGVGAGPYVVLPFFGPSTLRDTAALPGDIAGDAWQYRYPVWQRNTGTVLRVIDTRAGLLDAANLIEQAALDRYEFIRDGYLQRRENKIREGAWFKRRDEGASRDDDQDAPTAVKGSEQGSEKPGEKAGEKPAGQGGEAGPGAIGGKGPQASQGDAQGPAAPK